MGLMETCEIYIEVSITCHQVTNYISHLKYSKYKI